MNKFGIWLTLLLSLVLVSADIASPLQFSPFDSPDFCSQNITSTCNTTFSYIDDLNRVLRPLVTKLITTPYFKYFKLDFDKQCKFWNAQHFCATSNCAVEILPPSQYNWSDIDNDSLKPSKLGEINRPESTESASETETCEDLDYTYIDDDHHCVYVNLLDNPERFTGYGGNQSLDVWRAIYSENCFPNTNPMSMVPNNEPEKCVEKNLFYRLVSGMHASISVHLANEYMAPNGNFFPNLKVFMERVGLFNDRLSNIYFNYALVSQAIIKLSEFLNIEELVQSGSTESSYKQQSFGLDGPVEYGPILDSIILPLKSNTLFDTHSLFNPATTSPELKEEFRSRFKNVSAIMDCVGCDRCRMWGKLQTIGYGTSLKILFESEDPNNASRLSFRRIELVALFNTFDRLSKSLEAINNFKIMYINQSSDSQGGQFDSEGHNQGLEFPFFDSSVGSQVPIKRKAPPKKNPDAKLPEKLLVEQKAKEDLTFAEEFKVALDEVYQALLFVLRSYRDFPVNMYKIAIVYLNSWWNTFVGKPTQYLYLEEFQLHEPKL